MPTTDDHAIYFADGDTAHELDAVSALMAASVDAAMTAQGDTLRTELNLTGTDFPPPPIQTGERFWNTVDGIGYRYSGVEWLPVEGRLPYAMSNADEAAMGNITATLKPIPFTLDIQESHPGSIAPADGRFIAPVKGYYRCEAWLATFGQLDGTTIITLRGQATSGQIYEIARTKDGVIYGGTIVLLNEGDYFYFTIQRDTAGNSNLAPTDGSNRQQITFQRPA